MSNENSSSILQQIPLIITPNKFTTTKSITLPFEYKYDIVIPNIDSNYIESKLQSEIDKLESLKPKLDQLQSKGEYKDWEKQTLNNIAPGLFDDAVLKPENHHHHHQLQPQHTDDVQQQQEGK